MTFDQVTTALATMRRLFEYKDLKNQVFEKIQTDKQNDVLFELSKLGTN